jgi:hypothetical protein
LIRGVVAHPLRVIALLHGRLGAEPIRKETDAAFEFFDAQTRARAL